MKKLAIVLGFVVCACIPALAQNDIVQMEYFFDADPGFGNGVQIPITSGPAQNVNLTIATSGLAIGFHTLIVRAKEQSGMWGVEESRVVYVASQALNNLGQLNALEYYFDSDPGPGSGIPVGITGSPTSINETPTLATSALSVGFHVLHMRVRDTDGNWGIPESRAFYIIQGSALDPTNIVQLEYFFDTDPGVGAATQISVGAGGANIDLNTLISLAALPNGFHKISIRAKDVDGQWGIAETRVFYIDAFTQISSLEYFIDTDPGEGSATNIAVTPGGSIDETFNIPTTTIANGAHTFGVRAARTDGSWGNTTTTTFSVKESQTITFGSLAAVTYGIAPFSLTGTTSSALSVTYNSSNPLVATISGSTVTIVGAGTTVITASQPGDGSYAPATDAPQTLLVNKAGQAITFGVLATKRADDPPFTLGGSSNSALTINYSSSNLTVATISGNTVTIVGAGTTNITASQAGNGNYNAATDVVQPLLVEPANNLPSLSSTSTAVFFSNGPVVINNTIGVTDADGILVSATISITSNFQSSEDELLFDSQNGIAGTYNNTTGVLVISGNASVADYQTALRSIRYNNIASSPNTEDRTISFQLTDGIDTSDPVATVVTLNKPPVIDAPQRDAQAGGNIAFNIANIFSDPDDNLDLTTLNVVSKAGAMITISGGFITANYSIIPDYEGTDELTMTICDLAERCQTQIVTVELGANVNVFNGISANADGSNDFMRVKFLPPASHILIFNRWGDVVFESTDYDNAEPSKRFEGVGNDGNALVTGTYFYKVTLPDNREYKGYLYIKR